MLVHTILTCQYFRYILLVTTFVHKRWQILQKHWEWLCSGVLGADVVTNGYLANIPINLEYAPGVRALIGTHPSGWQGAPLPTLPHESAEVLG